MTYDLTVGNGAKGEPGRVIKAQSGSLSVASPFKDKLTMPSDSERGK